MKMSKLSFKVIWEKIGTIAIFIGMLLIFSLFAPPTFLTWNNITQIATQSSTTMLIACGEFFAILIAGIDLSVGSIVALTGMITAKLMINFGLDMFSAFLIGSVLFGLLLGGINGILVNVTNVHPFIITLGTQAVYRALTLILSNAQACFGFPGEFSTLFGGVWNGIPMPVVVALVVAALMWFITSKTTFGRNLYVIGGNRESAWYSGIHVKRHTLAVHMISGLCAGICGAVLTARLGAAEPNGATGYETSAIAAAIIGGTSFFGGKGTITGVIIGALILGLISNGLNMCSVPTFYQNLATGLLLIFAVALDTFISRRK
jgi:D-allose transport system permease protein